MTISFIFVALLAVAIYFLPAIIATKRDHPNGVSIIVLNFFLGWTLIGWVAALVWACSAAPAIVNDSASKKCHFCAEEIRADAIKCKHCGSLVAQEPSAQ